MTNPNIDLKKIEEANKLLLRIVELTQEYDQLAKSLNQVEQIIAGTMVIGFNSEYSDKKVLATIGHPAMVAMILNMLLQFHNQPKPQQTQPSLTPFLKGN